MPSSISLGGTDTQLHDAALGGACCVPGSFGAAKLAGLPREEFMQLLGDMAIPVIRYAADELDVEVQAFSK